LHSINLPVKVLWIDTIWKRNYFYVSHSRYWFECQILNFNIWILNNSYDLPQNIAGTFTIFETVCQKTLCIFEREWIRITEFQTIGTWLVDTFQAMNNVSLWPTASLVSWDFIYFVKNFPFSFSSQSTPFVFSTVFPESTGRFLEAQNLTFRQSRDLNWSHPINSIATVVTFNYFTSFSISETNKYKAED